MTSNWTVLGAVVVVLAIIGATTYLGSAGVVAGATVIQLYMYVLGSAVGGIGVLGGVHVSMNRMNTNRTVPEVETKS